MAKCAICNKRIGIFGKPVKLYDEVVCRDCWTRLGFSETDEEKYKFKSAAFLTHGKAECESIINEQKAKEKAYREYSYRVVGVTFKTENGHSRQKALKSYLMFENDEKYDGITNKDIKEECDFDYKYWEYPETEAEGELFITEYEGAPAIKVYTNIPEKTDIGWIEKESVATIIDMLKSIAITLFAFIMITSLFMPDAFFCFVLSALQLRSLWSYA